MQTDSVGPAALRAGAPPLMLAPGEELVEQLVEDDDWWLQPMLAGRLMRLIRRHGADVVAVDAAGQLFRPPRSIAEAVLAVECESCVIDGELVVAGGGSSGGGDDVVYHAFDLLERDGRDLRDLPYALRYDAAVDLVDAVPADALRFAVTAVSTPAKRALLRRLCDAGGAGVVFRNRLARGVGADAARRPVPLTFDLGSAS